MKAEDHIPDTELYARCSTVSSASARTSLTKTVSLPRRRTPHSTHLGNSGCHGNHGMFRQSQNGITLTNFATNPGILILMPNKIYFWLCEGTSEALDAVKPPSTRVPLLSPESFHVYLHLMMDMNVHRPWPTITPPPQPNLASVVVKGCKEHDMSVTIRYCACAYWRTCKETCRVRICSSCAVTMNTGMPAVLQHCTTHCSRFICPTCKVGLHVCPETGGFHAVICYRKFLFKGLGQKLGHLPDIISSRCRLITE